jgi:hypothetical protein
VVGDDLNRSDLGGADGPLEELAGSLGVPAWGDEHINDLAGLVDRPVHVAPPTRHLDVGLVDLPAVPGPVAARPCGLGQ